MKKLTKKQMKQLKGMLSQMDYNLTNTINSSSLTVATTSNNQSDICRIPAMTSDNA